MLSRALPEHDCVIPGLSPLHILSFIPLLCVSSQRPAVNIGLMICSKEGNFTSLQVLMIFYSLCSTLGDRKCSFETRPPTRKPENHARHEAATQLLFLKVIYIQSKFLLLFV